MKELFDLSWFIRPEVSTIFSKMPIADLLPYLPPLYINIGFGLRGKWTLQDLHMNENI